MKIPETTTTVNRMKKWVNAKGDVSKFHSYQNIHILSTPG